MQELGTFSVERQSNGKFLVRNPWGEVQAVDIDTEWDANILVQQLARVWRLAEPPRSPGSEIQVANRVGKGWRLLRWLRRSRT